ncbi:hypothetical protein HA466_0098870 [Hirschfeldia incana]|nr:hypothetical protein HA466_0098870 [Hirschfeldia incana]
MEGRKIIVCALPASGVRPQLLQKQKPQQEALNTEQQRGQSSGGNDVEEITRAEFRGGNDVEEITRAEYKRSLGYLTRIEEPEEDIDPMFRNSSLMRHIRQAQGQSSRTKSGRHY